MIHFREFHGGRENRFGRGLFALWPNQQVSGARFNQKPLGNFPAKKGIRFSNEMPFFFDRRRSEKFYYGCHNQAPTEILPRFHPFFEKQLARLTFQSEFCSAHEKASANFKNAGIHKVKK